MKYCRTKYKHTWSKHDQPKRTTQWSVMQQSNVSNSTAGIVASEYAKPGRRESIFEKYNKSLSGQRTNFVNITFITVSGRKYKKSLAGKPLLVIKQPW